MRGGFEVVQGALDTILPHEQWDYTNINTRVGYPSTTTTTLSIPCNNHSKSWVENRYTSNLESNELSDWVEHVTKQLIEDMPKINTDEERFQAHSAIAYDHHHSLMGELRPRKMARRSYSGEDHQNNSNHFDDQRHEGCNKVGLTRLDEQGLSLISLLLECTVAISLGNLGEAHRMVLELMQMASPYAPSCAERILVYFAKAMASRVVNSWLGMCSPLTNHKHVHGVFQVFNNISPFVKFAHFTSNQAILEAFQRHDRVHIIDMDIMQGLEWRALFHILATLMDGPPQVRMTGMRTSMKLLVETGKQLSNFTKRLGMSFEFHSVAKRFTDVDIAMLQIHRGDAITVHWLQHSLYDATGTNWKILRLLQELNPRIITLVEQDISHGGAFLDRFVGSLHYYSSMFDSLGAFLASDDSSRHSVEHSLLYKEINNVLAIGGPARSREDKFRVWRSELPRNGFLQVPMSENSMAQAQLILNMFPPTHGYSLVQGDGTHARLDEWWTPWKRNLRGRCPLHLGFAQVLWGWSRAPTGGCR